MGDKNKNKRIQSNCDWSRLKTFIINKKIQLHVIFAMQVDLSMLL